MMTERHAESLAADVATGPRLLLADHHRELEGACRSLLEHTYADDPLQLILQYRRFERGLLEHMAAEEEIILPDYAAAAPAKARAIMHDHTELRRQLFLVAVEIELHVVRAQTVCTLIDQLRAHAAREYTSMYPWAQVHLPVSARRRLFVRIGRSLRSLARRVEPYLPRAML